MSFSAYKSIGAVVQEFHITYTEANFIVEEEGWVQCLAEMFAAQQFNEKLEMTVFGIVSNGELW